MPTNYPANLDTWPTIGPLLSSTPHSDVHEDLQDAIEAIQAELGTNPSAGFSHVNQRIGASEFAMTQMRRVYADEAALANATPGEFVGQIAWVQSLARQYTWDGTHWKITGGNWPGCHLVRSTTHNVSTSGSNIPLSAHGGGAGGFRTGDILTVPAGLGGIYALDFGGEFTQASVATGVSLAVNIANNNTTYGFEPTQLVASMELENVGTFPIFPFVSFSRVHTLEPGATLTFSGRSTQANRGPVMSYIGLRMLVHLPGLT